MGQKYEFSELSDNYVQKWSPEASVFKGSQTRP